MNLSSTSHSTIPRSSQGDDSSVGLKISKNDQYVAIPLVPLPVINCNIPHLLTTQFVNIVLEENSELQTFQICDENNREVCRILESATSGNAPAPRIRKGVTFLECRDTSENCMLLIGYPVGLGEVALLSPKAELLGECQSNVEFECLSVKVKYNYYDANGNRLMKIVAIMPDEDTRGRFTLMVKRSKKEKLALIKMGALKTCCHIKFKENNTTVLERLQIIALWIGFMHNELHDKDTPALADRQAAAQLQRKESRRHKSDNPTGPSKDIDNNVSNAPLSQSSPSPNESATQGRHFGQNELHNSSTINIQNKVKKWKWKDLIARRSGSSANSVKSHHLTSSLGHQTILSTGMTHLVGSPSPSTSNG